MQSSLDTFSTALVTGSGGGIGKALARTLLIVGKTVVLCGRTESNLVKTQKELNAMNLPSPIVGHFVLDVAETESLSSSLDRIFQDHPDLDYLIKNAGVQLPFQTLGPDYDFDLSKADNELDINIRAPLHLSVLFIQKQLSKLNGGKGGGCIMNVTSVLGYSPFMLTNPVYCAAKSFTHFFTMSLRAQIQNAQCNTKVIEIVPLSVATDLHRERVNPQDQHEAQNGGIKSVLSIGEFAVEVEKGWEAGQDTITTGIDKEIVKSWEGSMGKILHDAIGSYDSGFQMK